MKPESSDNKTIKKYKDIALSVLAVVFLYFIFHLIGVGCPIKFLTGVSCLGCGMTRAYLSVIKFDFIQAFRYHPLWMLPGIWFISYLLRKDHPKAYRFICIATIILFIVVYIIRMILGTDDIVVFEPSNGFFYRGLKNIMYHK